MNRVVMVHPRLPGQEIEVPEQAVDGHRNSGWITQGEADAAGATPEKPSRTALESEPSKPAAAPRRSPSQSSGKEQ